MVLRVESMKKSIFLSLYMDFLSQKQNNKGEGLNEK